MRRWFLSFAAGLMALALAAGCGPRGPEVWIYTSIYKDIIDHQMAPLIAKALPDVTINWHKAGSEEIAAKVNAELTAGKPQADLILTSDPFWYAQLKAQGHLLPYRSPNASAIPAVFKDADDAYVTSRLSTMVMVRHQEALPEAKAPQTFKDLLTPAWAGKITMPDPMKSGTAFTTVAALQTRHGWDFFRKLKANKLVAAGGNGTVLTAVQTKQYAVGIVLLENILKAHAKDAREPVRPIYPSEGVILIPGPIAILHASKHPDLAKKIYDLVLSPAGQEAMVAGYMHSPLPGMKPPMDAPPLAALLKTAFVPDSAFIAKIAKEMVAVKGAYAKIMAI